jgi:colanic acid/amylovoran biosynthesis protein
MDVMKSMPNSYKDRIHIVSNEYDQSEIKAIIGGCDFFVGSRMHACIAALSQEIPTVGVAYSKKFAGVFESAGMEDEVVDGRSVGTDEAVERVLKCFDERDILKKKLHAKIDIVKGQISDKFEEILLGVKK